MPPNISEFLEGTKSRHGAIVGLLLGGERVVLVASPAAAKQVRGNVAVRPKFAGLAVQTCDNRLPAGVSSTGDQCAAGPF